jgi:hypothetical protein
MPFSESMKKKVPPEVSAYFSKIGKKGYKAKIKKLGACPNIESFRA